MALVAALLALALGSLTLHAGPGGHDGLAGPTLVALTDTVSPGAERVQAAPGDRELPQCAACALQAQSRASQLPPAVAPARLERLGRLAPADDLAAPAGPARHASSRGPPAA